MSARRRPVTLAPDARIDVSDILLYSEQQWGSQQRNKYRSDLLRCFDALRDHPHLGIARDDLGAGLRERRVEHHVVFYRILDEVIEIVRILHERMDATRYFLG